MRFLLGQPNVLAALEGAGQLVQRFVLAASVAVPLGLTAVFGSRPGHRPPSACRRRRCLSCPVWPGGRCGLRRGPPPAPRGRRSPSGSASTPACRMGRARSSTKGYRGCSPSPLHVMTQVMRPPSRASRRYFFSLEREFSLGTSSGSFATGTSLPCLATQNDPKVVTTLVRMIT